MYNEIAERELAERERKINKRKTGQVSTILSYLEQNKNGRLLEVGCGYGFFTKIARPYSHCAVAIDIATGIARSVLKMGVYSVVADGCALPFKNNSFDCVFSLDVIEHVENDLLFLRESVRVLKAGGMLIIGTPNRERLSAKLRKLFLIKSKYPMLVGTDPIYGAVIHIREYTKSEFMEIIQQTEVDIVEIKGCYLGLLGKHPIGIEYPPKFLERYCQFWVVKARKTRNYQERSNFAKRAG
jgi:SAM-dependent methyltransferase